MFIVTATYHPSAHFSNDLVESTLDIIVEDVNGTRIRETIRHSDRSGTRSPRFIFDSKEEAEDFKAGLELPDPHFKPTFTTTLTKEKE